MALILCAGSSVFAASWYVDKDASGSNNGTSWTNAWESFADISWSSVSSGDTVYISGGSSSKTYYETLEIEDQSYSSTVTVKPGVDSGHDGDVKIDGQGSRSHCVYVKDGADYITIDGLNTTGHTSYCIYVKGGSSDYSEHVTIKNCSIHIESGGGQGIQPRYCKNLIVENNTITTDTGTWENQSDGMAIANCESVIVRNNSITLQNDSDIQHNDCIQVWATKDIEIYNNYGYQPQYADNQQGIYVEGIYTDTDLGTWKVYNNVIHGALGVCISLAQKNDTAVQHCYNNTCENTNTTPFRLDGDNVYFKNNIGINSTGSTPTVVSFGSSTQTTGRIDYNCYYETASGEDIIKKGSTYYTMSEWQSAGFGANSINQDPSLDSNYEPDSSSDPVVNVGTSLSSHFTTDKNGTSRPQGSAWDMGAYEYTSGGDTTPPGPDPMTWAIEPNATGSTSISMTATTATDTSGVEYYFDCTAGGGNDSGWQDSNTYEDTGLNPSTQYTYRVKARDKSSNQNETSYSTTQSATTEATTGGPEFVTTIKQSGGDFSSLSSWESTLSDGGNMDLTAATTKVFSHSGISGSISAGSTVTGETSEATGTAVYTTSSQILIKSISGTFQSGEDVEVDASNYVTISSNGDSPIVVAKIDGAWTSADSTGVTISGWTTGANNYIKIYTTAAARHDGTPGSGYRLTSSTSKTIHDYEAYIRIDGL